MKTTPLPAEADELFKALRPGLRLVHRTVRASVCGGPFDEADALDAVAAVAAFERFGPPGTGTDRGRWLVERVLAAVERVRAPVRGVVSGALDSAGEQALVFWSLYLSTGIGLDELAEAQDGLIDPPIRGQDVQQKIESRMWLSARPTGRAAESIRALALEVHAALRAAAPGRPGTHASAATASAPFDDLARAVYAYESRRMETLGLQADVQLMVLLGTLAPDPLRTILLSDEGWGALPLPLRDEARDAARLGMLIRRLVERGLVRYQDRAISLDPSIRDQPTASQTRTQQRRWADIALRFLVAALPADTHYHVAWERWKGAISHVRVAVARGEEFGVRTGEVVHLLDRLSVLLREWGHGREAIATAEHAARLCESPGGVSDELRGIVLGNLALGLSYAQQGGVAAKRMRESLRYTEAAFGREHLEYAESLNNYANILHGLRQDQEAEKAHREALDTCRRLHVDDGDEALAYVMRGVLNDYASFLLSQEPKTGPASEARARQALTLLNEAEELGGYEEYGNAQISFNRADAVRRLGERTVARDLLVSVIKLCDEQVDEPSYLLFAALCDLSEVLDELGDSDGSARALTRAHEVDDALAAVADVDAEPA